MKVVEALVEQGQTERALDIFKSEVQYRVKHQVVSKLSIQGL